MEKAYQHQQSEKDIYAAWEASGAMRADETSSKPPFTIPLPPPNVTGNLHLGHAAMLAIEDIMTRYKKMQGHEVLWLPGTDHAAIATENVVIKHHGKTSREQWPSREAFLDDCRTFAGEKHDNIVNQMKRMGSWLDWSREAYTFDEARNHAVNTIFKDLYQDGLIERGYRLINWSVGAQSVLSDDELEWDEVKEPFYYIKCGRFVMGTVRPETKCADSPLVIHPSAEYVEILISPLEGETERGMEKIDTPSNSPCEGESLIIVKALWDDQERFFKTLNFLAPEANYSVLRTVKGADLVGETFTAETYAGPRDFVVIADEVIDPAKGSGAMTISASHSADDYDLAKRLGLDKYFIEKIDLEGNMTDIAGPVAGFPVKKARNVSGKLLEEKGLLVGKDTNYQHRVPLCYRSNCVVEPMISPQWFVMVNKPFVDRHSGKETTLCKLTADAIKQDHVQIVPERFEKNYFQWTDNLQDWCISRQIWWGHQIPVWYDQQNNIHLAQEQEIILVRHGESQGNADGVAQALDDPLTDKGRQHAADMIEVLKDENIGVIVSGTALRNTETASIIAEGLGVEVMQIPELSSYDFKDVAGLSYEETDRMTPIKYCKEHGRGEDFDAFVARLKVGLEKLKQVKADGKIVFVTNRSIYSVLQTLRDGGDPDTIFEKRSKNSYLPHGVIDRWPIFQAPEVKAQKFIFARHGESTGNRDKLVQFDSDPLTSGGEDHARALAEKCKSRKVSRIISSPSKRALDTAKIVGESLGLEVETLPELASYDFGSISGKPHTDIIAHERALLEKTGDTPISFLSRMNKGWSKLKELKSEGEILVISHRTNLTVIDELIANREIEDLFALRSKNEEAGFGFWGEHTYETEGELRQDEDTLDTWFSSALWPFSTLGWPNENHPDFQKFHPTDVLETGWDILTFWVLRMIMFGRYATGKYPFHTVYLHGMVTDEHGKKMSKSKGNGIDPLEMIDEYGADPVRLALVIGSTPGQKIPIGRNKIKGYRNFVNKLWNATRFVGLQSEGDKSVPIAPTGNLSLADEWILSRLAQVAKEVATALDTYDISTAGDTIYHFVWGEFCDWYLEASKVEPNLEVLRYTLAEILKLTHPLCPFITQQCWQELFEDSSLMDAAYPNRDYRNEAALNHFATVQNIVGAIRALRAEKGLNPKDKIAASIKSDQAHLTASAELIKALANLSELTVSEQAAKTEHGATTVVDNLEIFVDIPFDEAVEAARLEKDRAALEQKIKGLQARLSNPSYTEKAPPALVEETKKQLEQAQSELEKLT